MNVLVTGATGFIGSHLCQALVEKGHTVFGLSHSGRIHNIEPLLQHKEFHLQKGNILDRTMVHSLIRDNKIAAIFHLAAYLPHADDIHNPVPSFDVNAKGTLNLVHAAYLNGVDRFIYQSSIDVYAQPPRYLPVNEEHPTCPAMVYGVSKLEGEFYCHLYSEMMTMVILRVSVVYGQGQEKARAIPVFTEHALSNRPIPVRGDGAQTNDFVHVKDVAQANVLALEKNKGGTYNIGSGQETSIMDLAKRIVGFTNSSSPIVQTGQETNKPFRFALDVTRARKLLGYSPCSLEEGLFEHLREAGAKEYGTKLSTFSH